MRAIVLSGQYKKDLKLARKRNLPEDELNRVIFNLANDTFLPPENKDHALSGNMVGLRECYPYRYSFRFVQEMIKAPFVALFS